MNNQTLHGVIVPVITPIDDHEDVDEPAFRRALGRLVRAGVQGIFVGGSAGEGPLLTDRQWRRTMEIGFDEVGQKAGKGDRHLLPEPEGRRGSSAASARPPR